jgi:hypothetical protein
MAFRDTREFRPSSVWLQPSSARAARRREGVRSWSSIDVIISVERNYSSRRLYTGFRPERTRDAKKHGE